MPCLRLAPALVLFLLAGAARADDASVAPDMKAEETIVQAWGRAHPTCGEWSDGCVVCTQAGCSTPGVACTPREISCARP